LKGAFLFAEAEKMMEEKKQKVIPHRTLFCSPRGKEIGGRGFDENNKKVEKQQQQ